MYIYQHWDEIKKFFADSKTEFGSGVTKALGLSAVGVEDYLTTNYGLWLDMRSSDDNTSHGSGKRVENGSEGITIQLEKTGEVAGALNCYIYVVMDAQLNIEDGRFKSSIY